jgi:glutamine amidotransferase
MKVVIIKYNAGNTASVTNALKRLGVEPAISDDPVEIRSADKVIFPGVGEASTAMNYLRGRGLDEVITSLTQPVLGICLGMQLMCGSTEENDAQCMGLLPYRVRKFESGSLKVPHTGWNRIGRLKSRLFDGVDEGTRVYFVHGYYVEVGEMTTALTEYGGAFSAAAENGNFFAVQFHPEKSGEAGERILKNFLSI